MQDACRRRRSATRRHQRFERAQLNELWQMDFKADLAVTRTPVMPLVLPPRSHGRLSLAKSGRVKMSAREGRVLLQADAGIGPLDHGAGAPAVDMVER
jgi:hypothetical protein